MKKKSKLSYRNIANFVKAVFILLILFSFTFNSLSTAYNSHKSFYQKKGNPFIDEVVATIYQIKPLHLFHTYTGLNTGYGFFSPNVKSDIIIVNDFYQGGVKESKLSEHFLQTVEGRNRFRGVNDIFMDKLDIEEDIEKRKHEKIEENLSEYFKKRDSLKLKYLEIVLKQMNRHHIKTGNYDSIVSTAYLYHFPFLSEYPDVAPKFFQIQSISLHK